MKKFIVLIFLATLTSTANAQGVCLPFSNDQLTFLSSASNVEMFSTITDPTQSLVLFAGSYGNESFDPLTVINSNGFSSGYPLTGPGFIGANQKGFMNVALTSDLQEFLPTVFTLNSVSASSVNSMALGNNYDFYFSGKSFSYVNSDILSNSANANILPGSGVEFISHYSGVVNYLNTMTITSIPQIPFLPVNGVSIEEMRVAPNGNLYIIGNIQLGTFFFDPFGNALPPVTTTTGRATYIAAYDSNLHNVGFYKIEKIGASFPLIAFDVDSNGSAVFVGTVDASATSSNIIQVTDANNTVVASGVSSSQDGFILRLSPTLTIDEFKVLGGFGSDGILDVAYSTPGVIDVSGYFSSTADFDLSPNSFSLTSAGGQDAFVAQYDTSSGSLALQWANAIGNAGNDVAQRVDFTAGGDIVTAGRYFPAGSSVVDVFLAKYDFLGNPKLFQGVGLNYNFNVKEILALNSGKVVVTLKTGLGSTLRTAGLVLLSDNCP